MEKVNNSKDSKYDMIIDSDIMHNLNEDRLLSEEIIIRGYTFDYNCISMKELGVMNDQDLCM